jgi:hypothetical protein
LSAAKCGWEIPAVAALQPGYGIAIWQNKADFVAAALMCRTTGRILSAP